MTEDEIRDEVSAHGARNEVLLKRLYELGVKLDHARVIDFHFWAESERESQQVGQALQAKGFGPPQYTRSDDGTWGCEISKQLSPASASEQAVVEELVRLAALHSSHFEGWGTAV